MLTEKQIERYVTDRGSHCPYCHSKDIRTAGGKNGWCCSGEKVLERVECWDCNHIWTDVYDNINIIVGIKEE